MVLMIDNYDSFTYYIVPGIVFGNLGQDFEEGWFRNLDWRVDPVRKN